MYNKSKKFEKLVLFMAENYNSYDTELSDSISAFENAIEASGNGEAAFGIARDDWERIEITEPPYKYSDAQFYAEYYDGFKAPFLVCTWNRSFDELENLLKDTSEKLYGLYRKDLEQQETYERLDMNLDNMAKGLGEFYKDGIN